MPFALLTVGACSSFELRSSPGSGGQTMRRNWRYVSVGAMALIGLVVGAPGCLADSIGAGLVGAWTTNQADCKKLFVESRGGLSYRQPVDKFAQAAIIGPQVIRLPASTCRVQRVSHEKGSTKITAECNDTISYTNQTVAIRVAPDGGIVYSPTGDPALETTLVKCGK